MHCTLDGNLRKELVSVIIPSRHRPVLLQRAIDSINAQTYSEIEIVLFDNCSDTPIVPQDIQSKLPLKIVRSERFERLPVSRNRALSACAGSFIAYLDDDDEYTPQKFEDQMAVFRRSPGVDMVYGNTEHRAGDAAYHSTGPPSLNEYLLHRFIHPNSFTIRREVLDSVAFDPRMTTFEDVMFIGSVLRRFTVQHVDRVHAIWYRDGRPDQMTNKNYRRSYENWKRLCAEFRPELVSRIDLRKFYFQKMLLLSLRYMDAPEAARSLGGLLLGR
jgi:glycosyltransferase involved in cell wall biosynthesis